MKIVFTGGPCTGKSSVFNKMKNNVLNIPYLNFYDEIARKYLDFFEAHEPHKHPKNDRYFFQNFIETKHKENFLENSLQLKERNCIFDRGLVDEIAYRNFFNNLNGFPELLESVKTFRYDLIFFFPYWEEIYQNDNVRKETAEEGKLLDRLTREAYAYCGYDLIVVPKCSVKERIEFIKNNIK